MAKDKIHIWFIEFLKIHWFYFYKFLCVRDWSGILCERSDSGESKVGIADLLI